MRCGKCALNGCVRLTTMNALCSLYAVKKYENKKKNLQSRNTKHLFNENRN